MNSCYTTSDLPKVIFLAVAEAEGGKTSALEVEAKGEAEGLDWRRGQQYLERLVVIVVML